MKILSLHSAGSGCSVCLWDDGKTLALLHEPMMRGQDARLIPMVQDVMKKAGLSYDKLDRIAATKGPGSFTGIRIGLAAALGLSLAADRPALGVDRFALYHAAAKQDGRDLLVLLDARRAEMFAQYFPAHGTAQAPCMLDEEELEAFVKAHPSLILAGDVKKDFALDQDESVVCAMLAAQAALDDPSFAPQPFYVRPPDVTGGECLC
ncbi:MAG: tRNA (adenosine(37)-N6)-threonylcarbamoyltransferase complex dimerization subunit type 1 TsaB [Alphaproteobacteria bacterium]|nr:tRNA (adenosine(37)-N6)-threonylcarbamoyltransferase complex dimerization subunit type 1 TsaB [Alphaproteobacteria bacterium]